MLLGCCAGKKKENFSGRTSFKKKPAWVRFFSLGIEPKWKMNCFNRQKTGGKHPTKHFHLSLSIGISNNGVSEASSRPEPRHLVIRRRFSRNSRSTPWQHMTLSPSNMQIWMGQGVVRVCLVDKHLTVTQLNLRIHSNSFFLSFSAGNFYDRCFMIEWGNAASWHLAKLQKHI